MPDADLPDPGEPWAPDPTVRLARRELDPCLAGVDASEHAWKRVSSAISTALTDLQRVLAALGGTAEGELRHDVLVVTVRYRQLRPRPENGPERWRTTSPGARSCSTPQGARDPREPPRQRCRESPVPARLAPG